MKKRAIIAITVVLCCVLGAFGLALVGCGSSSESSYGSNEGVSSAHLAPTVPASHNARMENLNGPIGSSTCFGCHGANEDNNPMLAGITAMPDNHYLNEDPSTLTMDPSRRLCNTCHVLGAE